MAPGEDVQQEHRRRLQGALGDGYQLRELIGEGGFGSVYRAVDLKLKREVAVKVIRAELLLSTTSMERFQCEAQAVAQLRHPNVIPIYSVGDAEGLTYFIMPLISGVTLRRELDRVDRLSIDEMLRIIREVAGALQAAHKTGLVHRDIKPDNIMLEGDERWVLLMDFGVAKALAVEGEELTASGALVGTPLYMSPEQASGETHIDHRSDIYSLGVVAFQRDALGWGGGAPYGSSRSPRTLTPTRSDSSGIRTHAAVVQKIRSERATIASLIAPLPKSERDRLEDVLPAVDKLIARAAGVAKRLDDVEQRIENEKIKLEKNQAAISGTGGGVWDLRSALAEREEKLLGELDRRRGDLTGQLRESLASIYGLRDAVSAATASGVSSSMNEVRQAIEQASRHGTDVPAFSGPRGG